MHGELKRGIVRQVPVALFSGRCLSQALEGTGSLSVTAGAHRAGKAGFQDVQVGLEAGDPG